jgi:hypothetical protein
MGDPLVQLGVRNYEVSRNALQFIKLPMSHRVRPQPAIPRHADQCEYEALRQQADARAQQLSEILAEFAGQSANATAKALNDRKLPTARGGKWTARSVVNVRTRLAGGTSGSASITGPNQYGPPLKFKLGPLIQVFALTYRIRLQPLGLT